MAGSSRKISTIIEVGGEQDFKKSIKAMGQELAVLSTEMQKVTTSFSANDTEADKLRKTQEALGKQIEARKDQIAAYNKAIESSSKRYQEAEKALTELKNAEEKNQKAIYKAQSEYNKATTELQKLQIGANRAETALNQLEQEFSQNEKALKKWSMNISDLGGAAGKFGKTMDSLKRELKEFADQTEEARREITLLATAAGKVGGTVLSAGFNTGKAALEAYGKAATAAATAVAAIGAASVSVGKEFEASMSTVAATSRITAEEINKGSEDYEKLKQAALDAGNAINKFDPSEAAEALNYLALAGYNVEESIDALPGILNLAMAGNMDLASASDLATDALAALGMEASDLDGFMNKMARTAQRSNTNVAQLGEATLEVAGTAKLFDMTLVDMNAELGVLANRGIKGSEGGQKLRNVILSLSAPTEKAQKTLEKLNITIADDGKFRNINDILEDLNKSLSELSEEEKTQAIANIFNKRDIAAVNALLAGTGEEFQNLAEEIRNSNDAAEQMAEAMMNNLDGALTMLKAQLKTTGIEISEMIEGPLKGLTNEARETVKGFSDALKEDGFAGALDYVTNLIPTLGKSITEGIAAATPDAVKGFNSILTAGIDSLIENIPEAVSGIGYPMIEGFRDAVDNVVADSKDTLPAAIESIGGLLIDSVPIIIDSGFDLLLGLGDGFAQALPELLGKAGDAVKQIGDNIQEHKGEIIEVGSDLLYGLLTGLEEAMPDVLIGVGEIAEGIVEGLWWSIYKATEKKVGEEQQSAWEDDRWIKQIVKGATGTWSIKDITDTVYHLIHDENRKSIERSNEYFDLLKDMQEYTVDLLRQGKTAEEAVQSAIAEFLDTDDKIAYFRREISGKLNEAVAEEWRKNIISNNGLYAQGYIDDVVENTVEAEEKIMNTVNTTNEAIKNGGGRMAEYYQKMGEAALEAQETFRETTYEIIDLSEEAAQEAEEAEEERQKTVKEIRQSALNDFKAIQKEEKDAFTKTMTEETDALKEEQKEQTSAVKKSHEAQTKALKEAQKEQQDALEKSHKKRLDQIDEEYLEQLKLVDEEAYNRIKAAQAEIDAIDAQTEKEERERELAEEAEKRRRLQEKVWNAQTAEDRRAAQEDLNEFEEEIRRKRIKEERDQQKKDLNQEISDIQKIADEESKRSELQQKVWDSEGDEREKAAKELSDYEAKINKERIEDGRAERYADLILSYENTRQEAEKERDLKKNLEDQIYDVRKTNLDLIQSQELSHLAGMQEAELKSLEIVQKQRLKDLEEFQEKRKKVFDEAQETEYSSLSKNIGSQLGIKEDTAEQEKQAQSESILNAYLQGRESATENISPVSEAFKNKESIDSFAIAATDFTAATADFQNVVSAFSQSVKGFEQISAAPMSDFTKANQPEIGSISVKAEGMEEIESILEKISDKLGTPQPVQMDIKIPGGANLARVMINNINDYIRTTGKDPWLRP